MAHKFIDGLDESQTEQLYMLNPKRKMMILEFHYFDGDEESPSYTEEVSLSGKPRTIAESMNGIMKEARISNYAGVYWEGLFDIHGDEIFDHDELLNIAKRLSDRPPIFKQPVLRGMLQTHIPKLGSKGSGWHKEPVSHSYASKFGKAPQKVRGR